MKQVTLEIVHTHTPLYCLIKRIFKLICLFIFISFLVNYIINCFFEEYKLNNYSIVNLIINPKTYILNLLIIIILILILNIIFNNIRKSTILITIFLSLLSILNYIKLYFLDEPIVFSDIYLLSMMSDLTSIAIDSNGIWILFVFISIVLYTFFIILLNYYLKNKNVYERIKINNIYIRIIIGITGMLLLIFLFTPNMYISQYILNNIYNKNERLDFAIDAVSNKGYYMINGFIGGIYGKYLEGLEYKPLDYNEIYTINELQKYNNINNKNKYGKPNIIMILGESFWDISKIEEVKFDKKLLPNLHKFKQDGTYIKLLSACFGGLTSNVEFEVITGGNLKYYGEGSVPYLYKYGIESNKNPSIIKELKNNGYYTTYISPTNPSFYNRHNVYKSMDIDEIIFEDDLINCNLIGGNVSNKTIVDNVINILKKNDKENLFLMALTEEPHMPFYYGKYNDYDISIIDSKLSQEENETILSYAQSIYSLDKEINRLYEYIKILDEPTVLVFFGDHLPYLKTDSGIDIMKKLSILNSENEINNILNKYTTECVILSNYEIEKEDIDLMGQDYLGTYILNKMDIKLSNYYKYLNNQMKYIPASNRYITKLDNGSIIYTSQLKGVYSEKNKIRENVQYMLFNSK